MAAASLEPAAAATPHRLPVFCPTLRRLSAAGGVDHWPRIRLGSPGRLRRLDRRVGCRVLYVVRPVVLGDVDRAALADHPPLPLARVLEPIFDLARDPMGEQRCLVVVDVAGTDDDPD